MSQNKKHITPENITNGYLLLVSFSPGTKLSWKDLKRFTVRRITA